MWIAQFILIAGAIGQTMFVLDYFDVISKGMSMELVATLLWGVLPFGVFAIVAIFIGKSLGTRETRLASTVSAVFVVLTSAVLYMRLLSTPAFDPEAGYEWEPNLVFLFAPIYHLFVVFICTVFCIAVGLWVRYEDKIEDQRNSSR